jgi:hypothetical protein
MTEVKTNAMDVVNLLEKELDDLPENARFADMERVIIKCMSVMALYKETREFEQLEVENLSKEQFEDATLQAIANKYGITMNQVVGYMDMCDKINQGHLSGSGMTVVPFWFHEQYVTLKQQNEALINEANALTETVKSVQGQERDLSVHMPERQSIITGQTQPYQPGVTGPRVGDEHLDQDNSYMPLRD